MTLGGDATWASPNPLLSSKRASDPHAQHYETRLSRDAAEEAGSLESAPSDNISPYTGSHDVHEEVLSWLRPMIDELPLKYRKPLLMADIEGKTQQEVAAALGLSLSGAKSRVQRGRAMLGELLQRCCAIEFGDDARAVSFHRLNPKDDPCAADGCGSDGAAS